MNHISENIKQIKKNINCDIQLIIVSKNRTLLEIEAAYDSGHKVFAENRVQALLERKEVLPSDIQWHLIGHLQTNKVKLIAPFISMVHSVDSYKIAEELNKYAMLNNRKINCLLQIKIAEEETKFGFHTDEVLDLLESKQLTQLSCIKICGLMGMASNTDKTYKIKDEFQKIKLLFNEIKDKYFKNESNFKELSIGMSNDYKIAIENGSTMIRIGSAIFD